MADRHNLRKLIKFEVALEADTDQWHTYAQPNAFRETPMTLPLIPTTIIGSLPKPSWLAADWYSIAGNWRLSGDALREAQDDATRLAVAERLSPNFA